MNPVMQNVIVYCTIIFLAFFVMNFLTSGFIIQFMKAKAGRGKKALIKLKTVSGYVWITGVFSEDELYYTNKNKIQKILTVQPQQVQRLMNVPYLTIDDLTNSILNEDFTTASGHDASNVDNLLNRILMAPSTKLEKFVTFILIIVIVIALIVIVTAFITFMIKSQLPDIQNACSTSAQTAIEIKKHFNITNIQVI